MNMAYRWLMTAILCFVQLLLYYQRTAMSIAIVEIVHEDTKDDDHDHHSHEVLGFGSRTDHRLTKNDVGPILAAGWIGSIIGPLPLSYLISRFGSRKFMLLTFPTAAILTILTPLSVSWGFSWTFALKLVLGILPAGQSSVVAQLGSKWIPSNERGKYFSANGIADTAGDMFSLIVGGCICYYVNWQASFYILGGVSFLASIFIYLFVYDTPNQCPRIGQVEKEMLIETLNSNSNAEHVTMTPPYAKMLKCPAVWACVFGNISDNLNYCLLSIVGPMFLHQVFDVHICEVILGCDYFHSVGKTS